MDNDRHKPRQQRSFLSDAYTRIVRPSVDSDQDESPLLSDADRQRLLQMAYLWPITCCGVFLPFLVYLQYRSHDDLSIHARHGALMAAGYTLLAVVLGAINGLAGRIASDWVDVALVCGGTLMVVAVVLTLLGLRWYKLAVAEEPVEIPFVTSLADRI